MKKTLGLLISIGLISHICCAEIVIQYEPRAYLYSQVRDKIEHDTPYDIELPYIDEARQKKFMPSQLSLMESLNWIVAYFEKENELTLNYVIKEHRVIFQKASSLPKEEQEKVLATKLKLVGNQWTLAKAIKSASQQSGIKIKLPFKDLKELTADYNYECSLGEFIEEIQLYWVREMGYRIHSIIEKEEINFYKGGKILTTNPKANHLLHDLKRNFSTPSESEENK